jgi:hypothetical protein
MWWLPWARSHYPAQFDAMVRDFPGDMAGAPCNLAEKTPRKGDPHDLGEFVDDWGCVFMNIQEGAIGEVKKPLIEDWGRDLEKVHIPREWLTFDREEVNRFCRSTPLFVRGSFSPRPFERLQFLRGSENLYIDIGSRDPDFLKFLAEIHEFYKEGLEEWAKTEVDALGMLDDWGAQSSLLISPTSWRELFKPLYRDYARIAHDHGKKFFMHTDGYVLDIYEDLVEIGIDALNSQIFCMGVGNLAPFAGRITFWGEIDRQHLLPNATVQEIHEAVELVGETLCRNGGVFAQCEFGLGAKPENVRAVYEAWDAFSDRRLTG